MSDGSGLSRRQFVQALVATGAFGLVSGAGTRAFVSDEDTFPDNEIQAWTGVDVTAVGRHVSGPLESVPQAETAWSAGGGSFGTMSLSTGGNSAPVGGNSASVGGNSAPVGGNSDRVGAGNSAPVGSRRGSEAPAQRVLAVGPLVSGQPQSLVLSLGVDTCDPVNVWLRMRPENPQNIDLAKVRYTIDMRVAVAPAAEFDDVQYAGKMGDLVQDEFDTGALLSSGCNGTASSVCRPLFLGLEWTMPTGRTADEDVTANYVLDVVAQQCNRTNSRNPWS